MTALATLAAGAVLALVAALADGGSAALSALLGAALVAAFFWTGRAPLAVLQPGGPAGLALVVLLVNYALRLLVVVVVLRLAARAELLDSRWVALSVIACTLVWTSAQVAGVLRSKATL